jgi:hypothetical protein
MNVAEVFEFMNRRSRAVLATAGENGQPQAALMGFASDAEIGNCFRHGEEFAQVSKIENQCARGVGDRLHDGSDSAIRGRRRGMGRAAPAKYKQPYFAKFPEGLAGKLAGDHRFCGASEVGAVPRYHPPTE